MRRDLLGLVAALSLLTVAAGCSPSNKKMNTAEYKLQQQKAEEFQSVAWAQVQSASPMNQIVEPAEKPFNNEFFNDFCSLIQGKKSKEEMATYFSEAGPSAQMYISYLRQFSSYGFSCRLEQVFYYTHPVALAQFELGGKKLYLELLLDKNVKLLSFVPFLHEEDWDVKHQMVTARDGTQLSTYVFKPLKPNEEPLGTILTRTPYMQYSGGPIRAFEFVGKNVAVVLQSNRGSHLSTGEFEWLGKVNIRDGEDTINWVAQQDFSNGRVIAYGTSYDGYNALAAAANNPAPLKAVIACSAPANAATDSFTSNRFVEKRLFTYIRWVGDDPRDRGESITRTLNKIIPKAVRPDLDDVLMSKDFADWNETSQAIDSLSHAYWQERTLYPELLDIKVPVLHVAGLNGDQDGRDTLLAYDHIRKNRPDEQNNFLILHPGGHGCGNSSKLEIYDDILSLVKTDSEAYKVHPRVFHYQALKGNFVTGEKIGEGLAVKELSLSETVGLTDALFMEASNSQAELRKTLVFPVSDNAILNGTPTFKLFTKAIAPQVPIHANIYIFGEQGELRNLLFRTAMVTQTIGDVEYTELTFPPIFAVLKPGFQIVVSLSTYEPSVFFPQPDEKLSFKLQDLNSPTVQILAEEGAQSTIELPMETL